MSEIRRSPFRVIFLAATILTLLATSSLSADMITLRKQAEAGDAESQFFLGLVYIDGEIVPQDYAEAAKWHRKAAEQGNVLPQYNLGFMYAIGRGVPKDDVQSYFWFSLAASRSAGEDHKKYSGRRDQVAKMLPPEKLMEAQRMTREWEKSHPRK